MLSRKSPKTTIFVTEIICMVLELCASYLFSPFFGNSNTVWTGIIGVILLSNSIGNYIGGRLAKQKDKDYVPSVMILASFFIFLLGISNDIVCYFISSALSNVAIGSLITSFVLLLPAEICLGTIPPQIMSRVTGKNENDVGIVYMLSTIGGLVGTFLGGYFLIPAIGVNIIVLLCGISTLLIGADIDKKTLFSKKIFASVLCCVVYIVTIVQSNNNSILYENTLVFDSEYNRITIFDSTRDGQPVRYMKMASGFESATYTDEELRNELIFGYFTTVTNVTDITGKNDGDMLMIGGAAYQYPKYVLAHSNANIDVVEIDSKVTGLAKKYFYLQDCIDEFDKNGTRLGLYTQDAKVYIKQCDKKYDAIFNDAFTGSEPVRTLTTLESVKEFDSLLNEDGIYVVNMISGVNFENSEFLRAECKTISQVFEHIYICECNNATSGITNYCVVASHKDFPLESLCIDYSDSIVLTDNYCPVESLTRKTYIYK